MRLLFFCLLMLPTTLRAEVPKVATDIAPVHALVATVMQGVGTPDLVIPPGASPHSYAMRPSEARHLSAADLVVWVGPALTPWLSEPLEALSADARKLVLMEAEGMRLLPFRAGEAFGAHDHDHGHDHKGHEEGHEGHDHAHEAHDEAAHDDEGHGHEADEQEESHDHEGQDHKDHDHAEKTHAGEHAVDPHIWLDPVNGAAALDAIAQALAELDPENAAAYRANAKAGRAQLQELATRLAEQLAPARGKRFIVFHDAFHYFEARFDVEAVGSVSAGDAATPGPARIAMLRGLVAEMAPECAFSEPQMNTGLLRTVLEGQATKLATVDPLGAGVQVGAGLYVNLLQGIADAMTGCLVQ